MKNQRKSRKRGNSTSLAPTEKAAQIQEIWRTLPAHEKSRTLRDMTATAHVAETFMGPLPRPEDFEKYEQILPGAAERILAMAEKEQQVHADSAEKTLANDARRIRGATLVSLALVGVAGLGTWQGYALIAVPLGLAGVVGALLRHLITAWRAGRQD